MTSDSLGSQSLMLVIKRSAAVIGRSTAVIGKSVVVIIAR